MPPISKRRKQLRKARKTHSEICSEVRRAIHLSLDQQVAEQHYQYEEHEALINEHAQDWQEIIASDVEVEEPECGSGEEDGVKEFLAEIARDCQAYGMMSPREPDSKNLWMNPFRTSDDTLGCLGALWQGIGRRYVCLKVKDRRISEDSFSRL